MVCPRQCIPIEKLITHKNCGKLSNGLNLQINISKCKMTIQELMLLEMAEVKEPSLKAIPAI